MDDIRILDKIETVERCVARAREEYYKDPATFESDFTRQDAAVLNILRACEACIDIGNIIVRQARLGLPKSNAEVFDALAAAGWCDQELAGELRRMVGYRNVVVHAYKELEYLITVAVIERHLDSCLAFCRAVLARLSASRAG